MTPQLRLLLLLLLVQLASPMYHIGFINEVYKLLQCVCFHCSRIRLTDPGMIQTLRNVKDGKKRLAAALLECRKVKRCGSGTLSEGGCNFVQVRQRARGGVAVLLGTKQGCVCW